MSKSIFMNDTGKLTPFLEAPKIRFGHSSPSISMIALGFQYPRKAFMAAGISSGANCLMEHV